MEKYKVTEKDLIGDIKDFPIEVVQRMVDCQLEQDNKACIDVLQGEKTGGFEWRKTKEGLDFWHKVIEHKNFNLFFQKYPKQKQLTIQKDMETNKIILNGITLPTDTEVKVSVEDGATIITFQNQEEKDPEFKDGDMIFLTDNYENNYIAIFEAYNDKSIIVHGWLDSENNVFLSAGNGFFKKGISSIRCATEYEILKLNKEFAEQKYLKWNAEELKFEPIRWRAEKGGKYWYISAFGDVCCIKDNYFPCDDTIFNSRNYFQTEELANKALPLWKDFFKNLSL